MKLKQFVETFPGEITLAPATLRRELSGRSKIASIRPRKDILSERIAAKLLDNSKSPESRWIEHRYLEDGVRVNGKLIKLICWQREVSSK